MLNGRSSEMEALNYPENKENVSCHYNNKNCTNNTMESSSLSVGPVTDGTSLLSTKHNCGADVNFENSQTCDNTGLVGSNNSIYEEKDALNTTRTQNNIKRIAQNGSGDDLRNGNGHKNTNNMLTTQPTRPKGCDCGHQRPRLSLNIGKIKANPGPPPVYANGEPMEMGSNGVCISSKHPQNGCTLKKWDSFEMLENWCEKSLLDHEKGGVGDGDNGDSVNYFKDLVEYVEENGMDICTDKEAAEVEGQGDGVFQLRKADSFEMLEQWCDKKVKTESSSSAASHIEEVEEGGLVVSTPPSSNGSSNVSNGNCPIEKSSVGLVETRMDQKGEDISTEVMGIELNLVDKENLSSCKQSCDRIVGIENPVRVNGRLIQEAAQHNTALTSKAIVNGPYNTCLLATNTSKGVLETGMCKGIPDIQISPVNDNIHSDKLVVPESSDNDKFVRDSSDTSNVSQINSCSTSVDPLEEGCLQTTECNGHNEVLISPESQQNQHHYQCSNISPRPSRDQIISTFQPLVFKETNFIPSPRCTYGSPSVPNIPKSLAEFGSPNLDNSDASDTGRSISTGLSSPGLSKGALSDVTSLKTGSYNSLNSFSSEFSDLSRDLSQSVVFQEPNFARGVLNIGHLTVSTPSRRSGASSQSHSSSQGSPSHDNCTKASDSPSVLKRAWKRDIVDNDASLNELNHKLQKLSVEHSPTRSPMVTNLKKTSTSLLRKKGQSVKETRAKDSRPNAAASSSSPNKRLTPVKKTSGESISTERSRPFSPLIRSPMMSRSSPQPESSPSRSKCAPVGQVYRKLTADSVQRNNRLMKKCESSPSLYSNRGGASPVPSNPRRNDQRPQIHRQPTPRYPGRQRSLEIRKDTVPTLNFDDTDSTTTDDTDISETQDSLIEKQKQQLQSLRQQEKKRLHHKLRPQVTGSPRCCSPVPSSPQSPVDDYTCVRFKDAEAVNLKGPELEAVTKLYTLCNGQQQAKIIKQATAPMIFNATVYEVKEAYGVKWPADRQMVQEEPPSVLHEPTDTAQSIHVKAILKMNEVRPPFPYFDEPFLPVVVRKLPKRGGAAVQIDPSKM